MPVTQLDAHAALVVIDLQKGIVAMGTVHPAIEIVNRSATLARAFRDRRLPVVLVNVAGGPKGRTDFVRPLVPRAPDFADLAPELDQQPSDILVTKQCPGAFAGTGLNEVLQKRGVTQIFLAGISTSFGVESTARNAYDFGYNVVFIADAMTDRDVATHQHCVEKIFPRLGEIDTTANVLKLLGAASGTNGGFNPDRTRGNA